MFISSEKAQVCIEAYRSACYSIYFPFISPCHKDAVDIAASLGFQQLARVDFAALRGVAVSLEVSITFGKNRYLYDVKNHTVVVQLTVTSVVGVSDAATVRAFKGHLDALIMGQCDPGVRVTDTRGRDVVPGDEG